MRACRSVLLLLLSVAAGVGRAQVAAPAADANTATAITVIDIAQRAEADEQLADSVQRRAIGSGSAESLEQRLQALNASHQRLQKALRSVQRIADAFAHLIEDRRKTYK